MVFFSRFQAAVGGLLFLACSQAMSATSNFQVTTVSMPAWNIITDTLLKMTPLVNGQRDDGVMSLVCDLARGDKSQQDVNEILLKKNINPQTLARNDGTLSLLVNQDMPARQTACSVYLISTLFNNIDNTIYLQDAPATSKVEAKKTEVVNRGDKEGKSSSATPAKPQVEKVFNQLRFEQDVKTHIAIAQATAQLYAILAGNLERIKGESWTAYQARIKLMVAEYAPNFLSTVKVFYQMESANPITARSVTQFGYNVFDSSNHQFIREQYAFLFRSRNVDWLGNGMIMGKHYFVELKILETPMIKEPVLRNKGKH
ncbi:hypothetical protein [Pluralibacter sp.]|jgi:hypothetical protein|uniref:hypothetical protein n=1 Tax=Pluralibacter sp. TaxID=1920032 RepID=UPI0025FD4F79|nr:hypothetical protein [Pluralibacter sp.]MBV8042593.1 hypothetical protein [Pluralibacter sp.]